VSARRAFHTCAIIDDVEMTSLQRPDDDMRLPSCRRCIHVVATTEGRTKCLIVGLYLQFINMQNRWGSATAINQFELLYMQ